MKSITAALLAITATAGLSPAQAQDAAAPQKAPAAVAQNSVVGPALYVTDIERSVRFYRDVLGMTVKMRYGPAGKEDVVLGFGPDPRQLGLMLLSDKTGPNPRKIEHGHGFDRFAVNVTDLARVQQRMKAAGMPAAEIRKAHGTVLVMMTTDPDGYTVEVTQVG